MAQYAEGREVTIEGITVYIQKKIAEGGFSHVFLASNVSTGRVYALKRMLASDGDLLAEVRNEIAIMKKLNHENIVKYYGSEITRRRDGGAEVAVLMEYCEGGHMVEIMNRRLHNRFTEPEILRIFYDTCLAVAHMHSLNPPLAHRDLKVENVLVSGDGKYKLCDFGSTTDKRNDLKTTADIHIAEADIEKNTTPLYRAPEMVDCWARKPLTEKVDIWALGVMLYKLAYFSMPFEDYPMSIVNAKVNFPAQPRYSSDLKDLIKFCLVPDPEERPDIYQLMEKLCKVRSCPYPLAIKPTDRNALDIAELVSPGKRHDRKKDGEESSKGGRGGRRGGASSSGASSSGGGGSRDRKGSFGTGALFNMLDWSDGKTDPGKQGSAPKDGGTSKQVTVSDGESDGDWEASFSQQVSSKPSREVAGASKPASRSSDKSQRRKDRDQARQAIRLGGGSSSTTQPAHRMETLIDFDGNMNKNGGAAAQEKEEVVDFDVLFHSGEKPKRSGRQSQEVSISEAGVGPNTKSADSTRRKSSSSSSKSRSREGHTRKSESEGGFSDVFVDHESFSPESDQAPKAHSLSPHPRADTSVDLGFREATSRSPSRQKQAAAKVTVSSEEELDFDDIVGRRARTRKQASSQAKKSSSRQRRKDRTSPSSVASSPGGNSDRLGVPSTGLPHSASSDAVSSIPPSRVFQEGLLNPAPGASVPQHPQHAPSRSAPPEASFGGASLPQVPAQAEKPKEKKGFFRGLFSKMGNALSSGFNKLGVVADAATGLVSSSKGKWVIKATSRKITAPKQKHVRRILVELWSTRDAAPIFALMESKRPLENNAAVAFKSLVVIHRILQEGPPEVLVTSFNSSHVVESMRYNWAQQDPESHDGFPGLVVKYSTYVLRRMRFHHEFPQFEGNFSMVYYLQKKYPSMSLAEDAEPDPSFNRDINMDRAPVSLENTAALLDFLESLLQLQAEVLPMVQADARSRQSDEIVINGVIPCKSSMLIPLARDAAYMCGALIFCLRKLNEAVRPEAIKDLNDRYCCAYLPTAEFVSACQKLPSVQPFIDDLQNLPMEIPPVTYEDRERFFNANRNRRNARLKHVEMAASMEPPSHEIGSPSETSNGERSSLPFEDKQLSAGNLRESEEGPDSDSDGDEEEGEEAEDVDSPAVPDLQASRATSGESMQRVHALLSEVMARPMNDVCADCSARRPTWASVNLGIFICQNCAGIHRKLGVSISKVRSVKLDFWSMDVVEFMAQMGNERNNARYEAKLSDPSVKPLGTDDMSTREKFIRDKYERKLYYRSRKGTRSRRNGDAASSSAASKKTSKGGKSSSRPDLASFEEDFFDSPVSTGSTSSSQPAPPAAGGDTPPVAAMASLGLEWVDGPASVDRKSKKKSASSSSSLDASADIFSYEKTDVDHFDDVFA
mgnify:CR=1 FL=1